jgi:hypothetical protein
MKWLLVLIAAALTMGTAYAQGPSFRYDPRPPSPPSRHVEPPPVASPPLTPFDRNMVPPGYGSRTSASDDIDLSERITFGKDQPKQRH